MDELTWAVREHIESLGNEELAEFTAQACQKRRYRQASYASMLRIRRTHKVVNSDLCWGNAICHDPLKASSTLYGSGGESCHFNTELPA